MIEYQNNPHEFIRVMSDSEITEKIELSYPHNKVYHVNFSDIICSDENTAKLLQQNINSLIHSMSKQILQEKK